MNKGMTMVILLLLLGVGAWFLFKQKGWMPSQTAPIVEAGLQPTSEPQVTGGLISEIPPPDVRLHYIAGMQYAKFETPILVRDGFKQWGVTTTGVPVVSKNVPESYPAWDWRY